MSRILGQAAPIICEVTGSLSFIRSMNCLADLLGLWLVCFWKCSRANISSAESGNNAYFISFVLQGGSVVLSVNTCGLK